MIAVTALAALGAEMRSGFAIVLAFALAFGSLPAAVTAETRFPYEDSVGVVVRLATEADRPFMLSGHTIETSEGVARQYRHAVGSYSSVLGCLNPEQQSSDHPDLAEINWRQFRSTQEADVCLFRIASSYQGVDQFEAWLGRQGFDRITRGIAYSPTLAGDGLSVQARWSTVDNGVLFYPSIYQRLRLWGHESPARVQARFDLEGEVIGMQIYFIIK